jgi:hypothetical protein
MLTKMTKTNKPTDREIVTRGLEMLRYGTLPSVLPGRLMDEFGLTPERARELAGKAIEQHKKEKETPGLGTGL